MPSSTHDKITHILDGICGVPSHQIEPESKIVEDLGLDSLDIVEMTIDLEEQFDIDITDEEMYGSGDGRTDATVLELTQFIDKKLNP